MIDIKVNNGIEFKVTYPVTENMCNLPEDPQSITEHLIRLKCIRSNTPVIFLLGWLGATDRHLSKYATLYDELGCITIRYTLPIYRLFFIPNWNIPPVVKKLLKLITDLHLTTHPVVFHLFSNNGAWLYNHISDDIKTEEYKHLNVKGCIFDSCPSVQSLTSAYIATYRSLPGLFIFRLLGGLTVASYLIVWKAGINIYSLFTFSEFPVDGYKLTPFRVVNEPFRWPQLFIYSKTDDLIPYTDVEKFADQREKLGVVVKRKIFDSPHVQHKLKYPEEYKGTVEEFISTCFSK